MYLYSAVLICVYIHIMYLFYVSLYLWIFICFHELKFTIFNILEMENLIATLLFKNGRN